MEKYSLLFGIAFIINSSMLIGQFKVYQCSFCTDVKIQNVEGLPYNNKRFIPCNPFNRKELEDLLISNKSLVQTIFLIIKIPSKEAFYYTNYDRFLKPLYKENMTGRELINKIFQDTINLIRDSKNLMKGTFKIEDNQCTFSFDNQKIISTKLDTAEFNNSFKLKHILYNPNLGVLDYKEMLSYNFWEVFDSISEFIFTSIEQIPESITEINYSNVSIQLFPESSILEKNLLFPYGLNFFKYNNSLEIKPVIKEKLQLVKPNLTIIYHNNLPPFKTNFTTQIFENIIKKKENISLDDIIQNTVESNYYNYYKTRYRLRNNFESKKNEFISNIKNILCGYKFDKNSNPYLINHQEPVSIDKKYTFFNKNQTICKPNQDQNNDSALLIYAKRFLKDSNNITEFLQYITNNNFSNNSNDFFIDKIANELKLNLEKQRKLYHSQVLDSVKALKTILFNYHSQQFINKLKSSLDSNSKRKLLYKLNIELDNLLSFSTYQTKSDTEKINYNIFNIYLDSLEKDTLPIDIKLMEGNINKLEIDKIYISDYNKMDKFYNSYKDSICIYINRVIQLIIPSQKNNYKNELNSFIENQLKYNDKSVKKWNYNFTYDGGNISAIITKLKTVLSNEDLTYNEKLNRFYGKYFYYMEKLFYPSLFNNNKINRNDTE